MKQAGLDQGGWVPLLDTLNKAVWPEVRRTILQRVLTILGPFPDPPESLDPQIISVEDAGDHLRKKVVLPGEDEDPLYIYLLVPKEMPRPAPAVLCLHSTTKGSGKDLPAGVAGFAPGDPPVESRSYALHMVRRGYVALAPDMLCDGQRVPEGLQPYDTSEFYRRYPDWSAAGKIIWDSMRAIDYLFTLDFVDTDPVHVRKHLAREPGDPLSARADGGPGRVGKSKDTRR